MAPEILKGVLGFLLLFALWIAVQSAVRRRGTRDPGGDVLADMAHGCGHCERAAGCGGAIVCKES